MSDPVIDVRHLTRRFGNLTAVDDVSFQVAPGSIFGLLGPNGSGKSTTIRMLCGVLEPTEGTATVMGHPINNDTEKIKQQIGYMSQQFSLYADLSVRENIEFYGRIYGLSRERLEQRFAAVIELTNLQDRLNQLVGTLSGGWKQRLALACAIIHEPQVLFLDEPTAGIDPVARRSLWDLLYRLAGEGVTQLVTTHYMDEAERCSEIGYLHSSRLIAYGRPDELKKRKEVTPPNTQRWEVVTENPVHNLSRLRTMSGVRDATFFGQTIHVLAEDTLGEQELLAGVIDPESSEVRPILPSLEDVFVTLTQQIDRDKQKMETIRTDEDSAGDDSEAEETSADQPQAEADDADAASPFAEYAQTESATTATEPLKRKNSLFGLWAVMLKEFSHIRRQPTTLVFMFAVPILQMFIFGYAINTQIEDIPTMIYDLDGRRAARELRDAFNNTKTFQIVGQAVSQEAFRDALTSGRAKVGVLIPPDYSDRLIRQEQVAVQVLIDGSDSQVATTALNATNLLGVSLSRGKVMPFAETLSAVPSRNEIGKPAMPIEMRARLLYNPDLESSHFFVPGLAGIILQLVTLFLTSFAIVREREMGTLEQLFVTPVGKVGLLLGKLTPYALLGFLELQIVLSVMVYVFRVPIEGDLLLLLALSMLFLVCGLGLGLLVSTLAKTQLAAIQFAFMIMLPSVLLSGFMFPRSQMPFPIYMVTFAIPVTYYLEILRGVVLRAASFGDLIPQTTGLVVCGLAIFVVSVSRFQKQIG